MQAVPSLVGTGTAVAAATTGLVFAQPSNEPSLQRPMSALPTFDASYDRNTPSPVSPTTTPRAPMRRPMAKSVSYVSATSAVMFADDRIRNVSNGSNNTFSSSSTIPSQIAQSEASVAPSSTATLPRSVASSSQSGFAHGWTRRHSLINKGEFNPPSISGTSRDSISSNGSWFRRLSLRPLSQHGSRRSSVGPDSPTLSLPLGSAAPIVSQRSSTPPQQHQTRNKLVKRTTTGQEPSALTSVSRRGSRSQMPTFRRPATSHQRSATLHQLSHPDEALSSTPHAVEADFSFDQRTRPSLAVFNLDTEAPEQLVDEGSRTGGVGKQEVAPNVNNELQSPQQPPLQRRRGSFHTKWSSFFHGRLTRAAAPVRGSSPLSSESSPGGTYYSPPARTIQVQRGNSPRVYLTRAAELTAPVPEPIARSSPDKGLVRPTTSLGSPFRPSFIVKAEQNTVLAEDDSQEVSVSPRGTSSCPQDTQSNQPRRSSSMNLGSPSSSLSKPGSTSRPRRNTEYPPNASLTGRINKQLAGAAAPLEYPFTGRRYVSTPPLSGARPASAQAQYRPFQTRSATSPANLYPNQPAEGEFRQPYLPPLAVERDETSTGRYSPIQPTYVEARTVLKRQRNLSSPLPPLTRLSSLDIDLTRSGASSSASWQLAADASSTAAHKDSHALMHPGYAASPRSLPFVARNRDVSDERSSTLVGSDLELRGSGLSGDDDDTDFISDTIYDSVRTSASTRLRSTDTPIESVFDDSPPSTAGNSKAKRLSIQEILGQAWESNTRIMEEEDEGFSTPLRTIPVMQERSLTPASVMHHFDKGYESRADQHHDTVDAEANSTFASTTTDADRKKYAGFASSQNVDCSRPSLEDEDDDDDWARIDDSGVTNHLSPPSRSLHNPSHDMGGLMPNNGSAMLGGTRHQRPALGLISGNGGLDPSEQHNGLTAGGGDRPRSTLFDWSESTVHLDKFDGEGHSLRPKTVHGKQELDLRNGRISNRKGPVVAHVRSQSVPVNGDPVAEGAKPATFKFGTWASSGPKNVSEDWDDDFDFGSTTHGGDESDENDLGGFDAEEEDAFGQSSTLRSSRGAGSSYGMIVPASIQATQPTVKAHSGQIRELSLLVNGLKRLCRHARDLNIVDEAPALWKEAENIIALASPDEDLTAEAVTSKTPKAVAATASTSTPADDTAIDNDSDIPRASIEFDVSDVEDDFRSSRFGSEARNSFDDDPFDTSEFVQAQGAPPATEMSKTAVVRERPSTRRRSVFSPDDDIFGGGLSPAEGKSHSPVRHEAKEALRLPQTPKRFLTPSETPDSAMIESIMEAMQQQRSASAPIRKSPAKTSSKSELFFNTNTLQELVKRANSLFHTLSDLVRRAELFTQSPVVTPRHDRLNRCEDGSPAFTRVFTDPSSPSKRLPKSHSGNSIARGSPALESPSTNRVSQRLQMMTVS